MDVMEVPIKQLGITWKLLGELETDYPYKGTDGVCQYQQTLGKVSTLPYPSEYIQVGTTNDKIMSAIATKPSAVAINATGFQFQTY